MREKTRVIVEALVSLGLLGAGLYVLITSDWSAKPQLVAAATGWVGLVIGYWLK